MPNAVRRIGLGTVFALLAGTLVLGHALKAPCASGEWSDNRQYTRLCYSDNVHQLATEQLGEGRLPYLDACVDAPGRMRRVPRAHDVGDAVRGLDLGPEHHRLLLLERDHAVDRGVRHRAVPLPARRRSRPVLRARPHACALRDDELGSARGRVRDGRHLGLPASQGRLVGGAPGARGRGQGLPAVARHPVRSRPLPREGTRQGIRLAWAADRRVGRGEPPVRARRAPRDGGSSSASTRPAWPTGTASGTWRASAPPARRA